MASKNNNNLAWGISLLAFGLLFLLRQTGILPASIGTFLFDVRTYLLIIGIIFVTWYSHKATGWLLIGLGVLFRLPEIISWTQRLSDYIVPVMLIVGGIIVLFTVKK